MQVKKHFTTEEIIAFVNHLWADKYGSPAEVYVRPWDGETLHIRVTRMYSAPGLTMDRRLKLSKFFDTMNVETDNEINDRECETCDYGSSYYYDIIVRPGARYSAKLAASIAKLQEAA